MSVLSAWGTYVHDMFGHFCDFARFGNHTRRSFMQQAIDHESLELQTIAKTRECGSVASDAAWTPSPEPPGRLRRARRRFSPEVGSRSATTSAAPPS